MGNKITYNLIQQLEIYSIYLKHFSIFITSSLTGNTKNFYDYVIEKNIFNLKQYDNNNYIFKNINKKTGSLRYIPHEFKFLYKKLYIYIEIIFCIVLLIITILLILLINYILSRFNIDNTIFKSSFKFILKKVITIFLLYLFFNFIFFIIISKIFYIFIIKLPHILEQTFIDIKNFAEEEVHTVENTFKDIIKSMY